jgi:hypothetical protein
MAWWLVRGKRVPLVIVELLEQAMRRLVRAKTR